MIRLLRWLFRRKPERWVILAEDKWGLNGLVISSLKHGRIKKAWAGALSTIFKNGHLIQCPDRASAEAEAVAMQMFDNDVTIPRAMRVFVAPMSEFMKWMAKDDARIEAESDRQKYNGFH